MNRNLLIGITAFGLVSATTTVSALAVTPHVQTTTALQASLNYCTYQTGGQNRTALPSSSARRHAAIITARSMIHWRQRV